jgi:hypothetical protein
LERWRWTNSEFVAAQVCRGRTLPPGVERGWSKYDANVIASVVVDFMSTNVKDGDWVRYDESGQVKAVISDERLRSLAVCLED